MPNIEERINEGDNSVAHELTISESTSGETLSVRYRAVGGSGTGTEVASVSGAAADTAITFTADWSGVSAGDYNLEIWQDFGGASERPVYPDASVDEHIIKVVDRFGT